MRFRTILVLLLVVSFASASGTAVYLSRDVWMSWLGKPLPKEVKKEDDHGHAHEGKDRVQVSPQARKNLRLIVEDVKLDSYWRVLRVPGVVVERRGKSDRAVSTPIAGVVRKVLAFPGEAIRPGQELFVLFPNSESLQNSQTELLKAVQEKKILQDRLDRLEKITGGAIPQGQLLDLRGQIERQEAIRKAQRIDLATRGLTPPQIDEVEKEKFLDKVTISAPAALPGTSPSTMDAPLWELEELKVQVGEQIQAGQVLGFLSNHRSLLIEGRGFKEDVSLLEKAAEAGLPIEVDFIGQTGGAWKSVGKDFTIEYMASAVDDTSQTFPLFIPLANEFREYTRGGKTYRVWRYRPGQRARLGVRVEKFEGFVLPVEAVVREGAETYVFQQNGDYFDRKPVHVLFEDSTKVVIENDGSIVENSSIAQNAASTLNRALKAKEEGAGGGGHEGHNH